MKEMAKKTTEKEGTKKAPTKKIKKAETALTPEIREEQLKLAAYFRWEAKGKGQGTDIDDWCEAEEALAN
jgi:hypothetical protein